MDAALNAILISKALGVSSSESDDEQYTESHDRNLQVAEPETKDITSQESQVTTTEPGTIPTDETRRMHPNVKAAEQLYDELMTKGKSPDEISKATTVKKIMDLLTSYKASLATCRTAKLWLQYLDMIIPDF